MNNKSAIFLGFVLGTITGSVVAWRYAKNTYEQIAQEEIDSVKEVFLKREVEERNVSDLNEDIKSDKRHSVEEYVAKIQKEGYTNYSDVKTEKKTRTEDKPYVISPEEFGEFDEYERISLTYYSNHILTDENNEIVEDVDGTVGIDSLTRFGEYEDDSVFVRNDARRCDYEILLDQGSYSEVAKLMPHHMEEE